LMPPSQPGVEAIRGSHRDSIEHRVEAQYVRFFSKEAECIRAWADRRSLNPVLLAGPPKLLELAWKELPKGIQERTILIMEDIEHLPLAELQARVESEVQRWEHGYERTLVDHLLDSADGTHAVLGLENTLTHLQQGMVRGVVYARGFDEQVSQCANCAWTDRQTTPVCPICSSTRRLTALRAVLPELSRRFKAPLEVVAEEAGQKLRQAGGIGTWLHGARI